MLVLIADKFEKSGIEGLKALGCDVKYEPDLADDVGWVPTLFLSIDPTLRVPSLIESEAGPFNWR